MLRADGAKSVAVVAGLTCEAGPEIFVAWRHSGRITLARSGVSALEALSRGWARLPSKGSVGAEWLAKAESGGSAYSPKLGEPGSGTEPGGLDAGAERLSRLDRPRMAARGTELMLLYVTDNGMHATTCSTPTSRGRAGTARIGACRWPIRTNTQAEFAPQVAYDGNGDAIAVWERVADPNFNQPT